MVDQICYKNVVKQACTPQSCASSKLSAIDQPTPAIPYKILRMLAQLKTLRTVNSFLLEIQGTIIITREYTVRVLVTNCVTLLRA